MKRPKEGKKEVIASLRFSFQIQLKMFHLKQVFWVHVILHRLRPVKFRRKQQDQLSPIANSL